MHRQVASAANIKKHPMGQLSQIKENETSNSLQQLQSKFMLLDHGVWHFYRENFWALNEIWTHVLMYNFEA